MQIWMIVYPELFSWVALVQCDGDAGDETLTAFSNLLKKHGVSAFHCSHYRFHYYEYEL